VSLMVVPLVHHIRRPLHPMVRMASLPETTSPLKVVAVRRAEVSLQRMLRLAFQPGAVWGPGSLEGIEAHT